jgi:hypothetical protein
MMHLVRTQRSDPVRIVARADAAGQAQQGEPFYCEAREIIEMRTCEMRTYNTKPGKHAEFVEIFRSKSIPAPTEIGMKILGPFLSTEDPDTFVFMRGFPDRASREPMKAKFYEGDLSKSELENTLLPMLESYEVVLVEDPNGLVRW